MADMGSGRTGGRLSTPHHGGSPDTGDDGDDRHECCCPTTTCRSSMCEVHVTAFPAVMRRWTDRR